MSVQDCVVFDSVADFRNLKAIYSAGKDPVCASCRYCVDGFCNLSFGQYLTDCNPFSCPLDPPGYRSIFLDDEEELL